MLKVGKAQIIFYLALEFYQYRADCSNCLTAHRHVLSRDGYSILPPDSVNKAIDRHRAAPWRLDKEITTSTGSKFHFVITDKAAGNCFGSQGLVIGNLYTKRFSASFYQIIGPIRRIILLLSRTILRCPGFADSLIMALESSSQISFPTLEIWLS